MDVVVLTTIFAPTLSMPSALVAPAARRAIGGAVVFQISGTADRHAVAGSLILSRPVSWIFRSSRTTSEVPWPPRPPRFQLTRQCHRAADLEPGDAPEAVGSICTDDAVGLAEIVNGCGRSPIAAHNVKPLAQPHVAFVVDAEQRDFGIIAAGDDAGRGVGGCAAGSGNGFAGACRRRARRLRPGRPAIFALAGGAPTASSRGST